MITLLQTRFNLSPTIATQSYEALMTPGFGLAKDAAFNMEGFRNVLALRAEIQGQWGARAPDAARFVELSYYQAGLAMVR